MAKVKSPPKPPKSVQTSGTRSGPNRLRIIGGRWRGTRLVFPQIEAIRPSPDRVRETLFNWLQTTVAGSRCLDLFAGSGALGLEALSRGAREVIFVDREAAVARYLRDTLSRLEADNASVFVADAARYLGSATTIFDIVFLDPPFGHDLVAPAVQQLVDRKLLAPGAKVYVECEAELNSPPLPSGWEVLRSKRAGQVGYHLAAMLPTAESES